MGREGLGNPLSQVDSAEQSKDSSPMYIFIWIAVDCCLGSFQLSFITPLVHTKNFISSAPFPLKVSLAIGHSVKHTPASSLYILKTNADISHLENLCQIVPLAFRGWYYHTTPYQTKSYHTIYWSVVQQNRNRGQFEIHRSTKMRECEKRTVMTRNSRNAQSTETARLSTNSLKTI